MPYYEESSSGEVDVSASAILEIGGFVTPPSAYEGGAIQVSVDVLNTHPINVYDVHIEIKEGATLVGTSSTVQLNPGQSTTLSFNLSQLMPARDWVLTSYAVGENLTDPAEPTIVDQGPTNTITLIIATAISLTIDAPTQVNGTAVKEDQWTYDGRLYKGAVGSGEYLGGKTIRILNADTSIELFTVTTRTDFGNVGRFNGTAPSLLPYAVGPFRVKAVFDGDGVYQPSESPIGTLTVEARIASITLDINPKILKIGDPFTWSGVLSDPKKTTYKIANKPTYLDESFESGPWSTGIDGPVTTNSNGVFSDSYNTPTTPGLYSYRSRFPGGSPEESTSKTTQIRILSEEEYQEYQRLKKKNELKTILTIVSAILMKGV